MDHFTQLMCTLGARVKTLSGCKFSFCNNIDGLDQALGLNPSSELSSAHMEKTAVIISRDGHVAGTYSESPKMEKEAKLGRLEDVAAPALNAHHNFAITRIDAFCTRASVLGPDNLPIHT